MPEMEGSRNSDFVVPVEPGTLFANPNNQFRDSAQLPRPDTASPMSELCRAAEVVTTEAESLGLDTPEQGSNGLNPVIVPLPNGDELQVRFEEVAGKFPICAGLLRSGEEVYSETIPTARDQDGFADRLADFYQCDKQAVRAALTKALLEGVMSQPAPGGPDSVFALMPQGSQTHANLDASLKALLAEMKPGWGPSERGEFETRLFALLEANEMSMTPAGYDNIIDEISQSYQRNKYKPFTKTQFRAKLREMARRRAEHRQRIAERQAERKVLDSEASITPNPSRYAALSVMNALHGPSLAGTCGFLDRESAGAPLTNFELVIDKHVQFADDADDRAVFVGRLRTSDLQEHPIRIDTADYADDGKLKAELYKLGGPKLEISCKLTALRNAVAATSPEPERSQVTTAFGWTADKTAFLVPGGRITADGFIANDHSTLLRLDLSDCAQASRLGLRPLPASDLSRIQNHVIEDLLPLHHRIVTHSLLGLTGAAILHPFSGATHRFAGWLKGETGAGKTLPAKLFMNFFGNFPYQDDGCFASWAWTPNALESTGYYFRDALFLVDDFKTGLAQRSQVIRLFQSYADGSGRGRLRSDASFNQVRWIRGQLLVTGENAIDDESSSAARTIIIPVERFPTKDLARRDRCLAEARYYNGVTLAFIQWLLRERRLGEFPDRVREQEHRILGRIDGGPNDGRIGTNFAVLAASYEQIYEFIASERPDWEASVDQFQHQDIETLLEPMLANVAEQRPIEIFWNTLGTLVQYGRVRLSGRDDGFGPVIGASCKTRTGAFDISTELALAEVQKCLEQQGRQRLPLSVGDIPKQLDREGKIVKHDSTGRGDPEAGDRTHQVRIAGAPKRCFTVNGRSLGIESPVDRFRPRAESA